MKYAIPLTLFLWSATLVHPERGAGAPSLGRMFVLEEASDFEEGCFYLCECPILLREDLEGRFTLVPSGAEDGFQVFSVLDLEWTVGGADLLPIEIHGSGTYRVSSSAQEKASQRLELDLVVGEREIDHYDSGLIPVSAASPTIDIRISRNPYGCFDTVFLLHANPALTVKRPPNLQFEQSDPLKLPARATHWGLLKSRFRQ